MSVVMLITFKLKKNASVSEFLAASEKLNDGYMSKLPGFISWKQMVDDETWADLIEWKTMEDAKAMLNSKSPNPLAEKFYSYLNLVGCKVQLFTVEKSYGPHVK